MKNFKQDKGAKEKNARQAEHVKQPPVPPGKMRTQKRRRKEKVKLLELLNPVNLRKQIDSYGYDFVMGKYMALMAVASAAVFALGMLFSLRWQCTTIVIVCFLLLLPGIVLDAYRNMYEHKKFLDLSDYMEQVLYSFKANHKILSSLRDTATMFRGKMQEKILEAAAYIEAGQAKENLYQEALAIIEEAYPNRRLRNIHKYLRSVEKNGGDNMDSVDLLVKDKNIWTENVMVLQKERRYKRNLVFGALVITVVFAAAFHHIYRTMPGIQIVANPVVQGMTTVYLILDIIIFRKANREIAKSWMEKEHQDDARVLSYYEKITHYEEKKEQRTSILAALPFAGASAVLFLLGRTLPGAACLAIGVFLLFQHKIGYRVIYNRVVKEINIGFSQWLMDMALHLQTNNIRNSIGLSIEEAPAVLVIPLKELRQQLEDAPDAEWPFQEFLKQFELSNVQSAMKMLYSLSAMGSGEVREQIRSLIERNIGLLDKAEKLRNEEKLVGIEGLFYMPQVTVSMQLICGLFMFMILFLQQSVY